MATLYISSAASPRNTESRYNTEYLKQYCLTTRSYWHVVASKKSYTGGQVCMDTVVAQTQGDSVA